MTSLPDTGRTIGATKDTAAFVRAQHARGVSLETLQRQLKIRPEHMLDMLSRAPEPPLPKMKPAESRFTEAWSAARRELGNRKPNVGGSPELIAARSKIHREEARALADKALSVVAIITGVVESRIVGRGTDDDAVKARSMVYGLMDEMSPGLSRTAIGVALGRVSTTADAGIARCHRFRDEDAKFNRRYMLAMVRMAS